MEQLACETVTHCRVPFVEARPDAQPDARPAREGRGHQGFRFVRRALCAAVLVVCVVPSGAARAGLRQRQPALRKRQACCGPRRRLTHALAALQCAATSARRSRPTRTAPALGLLQQRQLPGRCHAVAGRKVITARARRRHRRAQQRCHGLVLPRLGRLQRCTAPRVGQQHRRAGVEQRRRCRRVSGDRRDVQQRAVRKVDHADVRAGLQQVGQQRRVAAHDARNDGRQDNMVAVRQAV
eukprot:364426-Chlamydomonas_euryale.AAC.44